ncbi:MAG: DUF2249 domain-containing protein [Zoogloea sp.]|nr:DUF2249 domain-containing protein [Zoogloea sp.]
MSDPAAGKIIDARGLLPPEPLELTLAALDELAPGEEIVLLLYREPHPLYRTLELNGYTHTTACDSGGTYSIRIRHAKS